MVKFDPASLTLSIEKRTIARVFSIGFSVKDHFSIDSFDKKPV